MLTSECLTLASSSWSTVCACVPLAPGHEKREKQKGDTNSFVAARPRVGVSVVELVLAMGRDRRWRECYWFLVLLHGVGSLAAASARRPQLPLVVNTWAFKNANEIGATFSVLGWGGINVGRNLSP